MIKYFLLEIILPSAILLKYTFFNITAFCFSTLHETYQNIKLRRQLVEKNTYISIQHLFKAASILSGWSPLIQLFKYTQSDLRYYIFFNYYGLTTIYLKTMGKPDKKITKIGKVCKFSYGIQ